MKSSTFIVLSAFLFLQLTGCAFKCIKRSKNLEYTAASGKISAQSLNVFAPSKPKAPAPVFIFIHGGNWNAGKKSLYSFFGSRMARKGIVTVVIDYPLSPEAQYNDMALASAKAVKWVHENIGRYGGDSAKVFVSGHSAGGHLAALIAVDNRYFDSLHVSNPLKGVVLIDAAGLDMYGYLKEEKKPADHTYLKTFTSDPAVWKEATPLYYLHTHLPPFLIYRGEKTYPSILVSNAKFVGALPKYTRQFQYSILKGKRHIPMITQFFKPWNPRYREIIRFMGEK